MAFSNYHAIVASPDIDAVAVVVRVPSHYEPTRAALEAGKHVYCEWPLGQTTQDAVELAELARRKCVATAVGLQARMHPSLRHMKEQIEAGFVGDLLAVHVSLIRDGVLSRPSHRTWQRDITMGTNTLTIAAGHTLDAMRFVAGDIGVLNAVVATRVGQWLDTGTNVPMDVSSPDNVLIGGRLQDGAVASLHIASVPFAGSSYRMEIYGRDGTLVASGPDSPQLGEIALHGARGGNAISPIPVPKSSSHLAGAAADIEPANVARLYTAFARAIRGEENNHPAFDTAVDLHSLLDVIRQASDNGRTIQSARGPRL